MNIARPRSRVSSYFFEELKAYVGFDLAAQQALRECVPFVEPHYEAIVDSFYDALSQNRRTRAVFEGPEQIDRLRITLQAWLAEGFSGPWETEFFERRRRIGRVHVDVGLLPHFMGGAINIMRRHIVRVLMEAQAEVRHIEAAERLLDLELTLMHQSYWDHLMELKLTVPVALASGLAHEIRNPLNAIGLNLKILERRLHAVGADDSIPIVEAVRGEVRRIAGLTNEIMDFAKPVEINPIWHRSDKFLDDIAMMHRASLEAAGVTLRTEVVGDIHCYCDVDRMRQAIVNLLTNAVEAVEPGGEVVLTIAGEDDVVTMQVSDTGHGMDPSTVYRIFDLFYTLKASGTGLGLPIVKNIVDAHGGTIEVATKPGQGTTFTIRIPRPTETPGDPS